MTRPTAGAIKALLLFLAVIGLADLREAGAQQGPPFVVLSTSYLDINGDHDPFPDTNELGRLAVVVQNNSGALTGASFTLSSTDTDVACINSATVSVGNIASGQTVTVGSTSPGTPGFTFTASSSLQTTSATNPARVDLCLTLTANEIPSGAGPVCFSLIADVDAPSGASQTFVPGPDGLPGTSDDGTVLENFDVDRDGDGNFTVNDTFRLLDAGTGTFGHGSYLRGAAASSDTTVGGIACGGFQTVAEGNPGCTLDPDFPMDWHLHCPPGSTTCPNVESGTCVGPCSFATPPGGAKALSGPNSLHMGGHFQSGKKNNLVRADSTHLRTMEAFVSGPLNLALFPRPGDLQLSMFHIADLMDNNGVGPGNANQCVDCGDVQIQVDQNPDPAVDSWGFWDKLVPYQNVYDHKPNAWSVFGGYYCLFTPTDTGTAPPNPRGVHETICYPFGAWSHCGSVLGTTSATTFQCPGPGVVDPTGVGVWVETRFNLATYLGQRTRLRWIGSTWEFDQSSSSYFEVGNGWDTTTHDDGWWLDNISVTGVITGQTSPVPDNDGSPGGGGSCP